MNDEINRDKLVDLMLESRQIMPLTADEFVEEFSGSNEYINYCEVVIDKNGFIWRLHGSHQTMLEYLFCWQNKIDSEEMFKRIPRKYYFNFDLFLLKETGAISVRFEVQAYDSENGLTKEQSKTLDELNKHKFIDLNPINLANRRSINDI